MYKRDDKRKERTRKTSKKPMQEEKKEFKLPVEIKLFGRWESNVELKDPGLKNYINLFPRHIPRSAGVRRARFEKSKMHLIERLALDLLVSGHSGKKHKITSGKFGGGYYTVLKHIEHALEIIEKKENKNPVEVFVRAVENAALREEIVSFQVGAVIARESVITAPQRRIDKTLRFMAHGAYKKSFNKKITLAAALAEEIMAAYAGSNQSMAIQEKERIEREAGGAR